MSLRCNVAFVIISGLFLTTEVCGQRRASTRNSLKILQQAHRRLHTQYADEMGKIARDCEEQGFVDESARIRKLAQPVDRSLLTSSSFPPTVRSGISRDLPVDERRWRTKLRSTRKKHATELFTLARRATAGGHSSLAINLVREALVHDSDNGPCRRVLGFQKYKDKWVTPYAFQMLKKRYVWHPKFGWLPKTHVDRYEKGERYFKSVWHTAQREAQIRQKFEYGWEIRTDHFLVKTNHSLERGVELATELEEFYQFFHQTFSAFFSKPDQLKKLFNSARAGHRLMQKPHVVHYFRKEQEYDSALIRKIPQIAITNGLYHNGDRVAYFFFDPKLDKQSNNTTLFHEATHQLFYETQSKFRDVGVTRNFWIIEGIACYMESYRRENGHVSLGDRDYIRFKSASDIVTLKDYYVSSRKFFQMGREKFQRDPMLRYNYSQASGLALFFMDYNKGTYRDALIEHLSQIYEATLETENRIDTLIDLTGVESRLLDQQYKSFIRGLAKPAN